jgi:acyl-CoA dehydrogenase
MPATRPAWSDDDIEAFRDLARRFFEKECAPNEERWNEQQHVDRETWLKAGELGLLCPSVPTEYGGGGGSFAHEAVMAEEQTRALTGSLGTAVHSTIVAHYILNYGTEEQKQRWLPRLATGELVGAIAMTEPGTGSDLQSVKTKAIRDGDEYVIDGAKTFISNGYLANLVITVAKTDPDNAAAGISLLVVETDEVDGFSRGRVLKKIGQHGQDTAELFFDGVRVPAANLLGGEGDGFRLAQERLGPGRIHHAMRAIGMAERALEMLCERTAGRSAFGRPIVEHGVVQRWISEARVRIEQVRLLVLKTAWLMDTVGNRGARVEVSAIKVAAPEVATWVIDRAIQAHGGGGVSQDFLLGRLYAVARILQIADGPDEVHHMAIARRETRPYRDAVPVGAGE